MYSLNKYKELVFYIKLLYILKKINGTEYIKLVEILFNYVYEMGYNIVQWVDADFKLAILNYHDECNYNKVISAINEVCPREIAEYLLTKINENSWDNCVLISNNIWWLIEQWDCDDIL